MTIKKGLSYRDAGVDIDAGNQLVEQIKPDIRRTSRNGVMGSIGGFGGLFELPIDRYRQPVLVSGTDGVGTKLMLANRFDHHQTIGIDLVAMCVNDIVVCGAEPLFFLDYYATGRLVLEKSRQVIAGIADGCVQAGAALIGGETAEMPGLYDTDEYDLAGFSVGIVEKDRILDRSQVQPGHAIIGLASSGCHSNGYSLVRKVYEISNDAPTTRLPNGQTLQDSLMAPTRIYVKPLLTLLEKVPVAALSHITGGGITENVPRSLPDGVVARVSTDSWNRPAVFDWLQQHGSIEESEMLRTFNCGIGMVAVVPASEVDNSIELLASCGESAQQIGVIEEAGAGEAPHVLYS
jgi:phosphoribosylformylglycinamidine cyclo-ligase